MTAETLHLPNHPGVHCHLWQRRNGPDTCQMGTVIALHGLGDHGARFDDLAAKLLDERWAVAAIDFPGHGRSAGRHGACIPYDTLLGMVADLRQQLCDRLGCQRHVLLGHSMGGNLAVNYTLRQHEFAAAGLPDLNGLVLLAPLFRPPQPLDRTQLLAAWMTGYLVPWIRMGQTPDITQLTNDPNAVRQFRNDPLQHSRISLYNATQLLAQGRFALDHASELTTPTMVIVGDQDALIDRTACQHFVMRAGEFATFVEWPNALHDLLHDVDGDRVGRQIAGWISRRCSGQGAASSDGIGDRESSGYHERATIPFSRSMIA